MASSGKRVTDRPGTGRLRRALAKGLYCLAVALACLLWAGVALPGLRLIPGVGGGGDSSIAISLQSALLGIDDRIGRPSDGPAHSAARSLGLLAEPPASGGTGQPPPRPSASAASNVAPNRGAEQSTPRSPSIAPPAALVTRPATPAPSEPPSPKPAPGQEPPAQPLEQTISFLSSPPAAATVGAAYAVAVKASSGLQVRLSVAAGSAQVCSVSTTTVALVGVGTCTINADQPGNAHYLPAAQVEQSFFVGLVSQTITFTASPPSDARVGGASYVVSATASSGLPVAFSSDTSGVCAVSGSVVSLTGPGTCTINADQPGDATYSAAPRAQQSFAVGSSVPLLSLQTIEFVSVPPAGAVVGGSDYALVANASSGLPVSFTSASPGICTVSGSNVSFVGSGNCVIHADQPGNAHYLPAAQVEQSFFVGKTAQAIVFSSPPPAGATVGDPPYAVSANASSSLPVTFTADSASAGVCTVSGSTVVFVGNGLCIIDADQGGNGVYAPAQRVQQSFAVGSAVPVQSAQTISFTSAPPAAPTVGGSTYTVTASASSGLTVTFSSATPGVCSVSGSTVSFVGAGSCTVNANQSGNASYQPAPQAQQSFTVAAAPAGPSPQTISFTSSAPAGPTVGGATYTITASASSGLTVSFSSATPGICSVSGSTVSFVGAGSCTVNANQSGNASYQPALQAQQSFTVAAAPAGPSPQTISFTSSAPAGATVGGATYTVTASATSGLSVSFSSATPGVCSVSGSTVSFVGAGTCRINANQAGNASYQPAPQVQQAFTVSAAASPQTITFTSSAPAGATFGGSTYTVTASATSGLSVTFSSATPGVCSVSGSTVSFVGAGSCTINANQGGNASYQPAPQAQQSFSVARASQTITITSDPGAVDKNDPPYTITAVSTSGLTVTFTTDPASAGVCSVSGSTVTFEGRGQCIIYADQAGDGNYLPATQVVQSFKVKNHVPGP